MVTDTKGGIMKGLGRMFAGEKFFMNTYKANQNDALIAFATTAPGVTQNLHEFANRIIPFLPTSSSN